MKNPYSGFVKKREYLICIDSDGCAIDSMDIKHFRCFGPCMVKEWGLEAYQEKILYRWNQMNLYSMTRGINRFQGLSRALAEIHRELVPIDDIQTLVDWVEKTDEFSNDALERAIKATDSPILKKALRWSKAVNEAVKNLPIEEVRPFLNVKETLEKLSPSCDIAIVSSANAEAVEEEWQRFGLLSFVDVLLAQNAGSKKSCISKLLTYGYRREGVLMVGDAPGDLKAAEENGVFFYPILVNHEADCWKKLGEAVERLKDGTYGEMFAEAAKKAFVENLTS